MTSPTNPWERPIEPEAPAPAVPAAPAALPDVETGGEERFAGDVATDEGMPSSNGGSAAVADTGWQAPAASSLDLGAPAAPEAPLTDFEVPSPAGYGASTSPAAPTSFDLPAAPGLAPTDGVPAYGQPATPYDQPAAPYGQPSSGYGQPATPYGQPAAPYDQPSAGYGQPPAPYGQPASGYDPGPVAQPSPYGAPGAFVPTQPPAAAYPPPPQQSYQQPSYGTPYAQPGPYGPGTLAPQGYGGYPESQLSPADETTYASMAHWLGILLGFLGPLIVLLMQGNRSPRVRAAAVESLNFQLTLTIGYVVSLILTFLLVGLLGFLVLPLMQLIFPIIAALSENRGQPYRYPINIRMVK